MGFDQSKYIAKYKKEHYKRKEIMFKEEEWDIIEKILKKENKSIKKIILDYINSKTKKGEQDN